MKANHSKYLMPLDALYLPVIAVTLASGLPVQANPDLSTNLTWKADAALKETYDDNVYLQNLSSATYPGAMQAKKNSWITIVSPHAGVDYQSCPFFKASLSYAPDVVEYYNAPSEDYVTHRVGLTFSGTDDNVTWEQANAFTYIDGSRIGPLFGRPQDVPAIGGIPLRDRREAFIYRGGYKLTWTIGRFFIRPVAAAYAHDFMTLQHPTAFYGANSVYENYVSRQDVNGGVDIGCDVGRKTYLVLGYRYGRQNQAELLGVSSPYNSAYNRILAGVEGSPAPWLKLAALGGPEIRTWSDNNTPAGFDRNRLVYWVDATATVIPDKCDTVTLFNRRFQQPAFSSQSMYDDITYGANWKHTFNEHFSANVGFQLYIGDWVAPVNRNDWIYTPSAGATYVFNKHVSAEASAFSDMAKNKVRTSGAGATYAEGREFTRHLASVTVKYAF